MRKHPYSDQDAVQVHGFPPALLSSCCPPQDLCQALRVVHSQDVDVVLAAESLDEGEVDLQGHIFHIFVIGGQDAQNHIVGVPAEGKKADSFSWPVNKSPLVRLLAERHRSTVERVYKPVLTR